MCWLGETKRREKKKKSKKCSSAKSERQKITPTCLISFLLLLPPPAQQGLKKYKWILSLQLRLQTAGLIELFLDPTLLPSVYCHTVPLIWKIGVVRPRWRQCYQSAIYQPYSQKRVLPLARLDTKQPISVTFSKSVIGWFVAHCNTLESWSSVQAELRVHTAVMLREEWAGAQLPARAKSRDWASVGRLEQAKTNFYLLKYLFSLQYIICVLSKVLLCAHGNPTLWAHIWPHILK